MLGVCALAGRDTSGAATSVAATVFANSRRDLCSSLFVVLLVNRSVFMMVVARALLSSKSYGVRSSKCGVARHSVFTLTSDLATMYSATVTLAVDFSAVIFPVCNRSSRQSESDYVIAPLGS